MLSFVHILILYSAVLRLQKKEILLQSDDFLCFMYSRDKRERVHDPNMDTDTGLFEGYLPIRVSHCVCPCATDYTTNGFQMAKCSLTGNKSVLVSPAKPRKNCLAQKLKIRTFTNQLIAYYQVLVRGYQVNAHILIAC
jgi:hypothetical protein